MHKYKLTIMTTMLTMLLGACSSIDQQNKLPQQSKVKDANLSSIPEFYLKYQTGVETNEGSYISAGYGKDKDLVVAIYVVEDRAPRVYPWVNERDGGILYA